jgi:threonylcarbamoyladenosine tRNA methylthiotransferase MtaB
MSTQNRPDIHTFGCRLNIWESEVMRRHAESAGLNDVVIINTCAVTKEAERQARQAIRKLRREKPNAKIIVTGCAAQIDPDSWATMPETDILLGNDDKLQPASWQDLAQGQLPAKQVSDIMQVKEVASHFCKSSRDAIIAVLFALFLLAGGLRVLLRWPMWWPMSEIWSRRVQGKLSYRG